MKERFRDYVIEWTAESHHVEFVVKKIDAFRLLPEPRVWEFRSGNVNTTNFAEGECFLRGGVKYDGCSNWNFGETPNIHFCNGFESLDISDLIRHMYKIARANLPSWDKAQNQARRLNEAYFDEFYGPIEAQSLDQSIAEDEGWGSDVWKV